MENKASQDKRGASKLCYIINLLFPSAEWSPRTDSHLLADATYKYKYCISVHTSTEVHRCNKHQSAIQNSVIQISHSHRCVSNPASPLNFWLTWEQPDIFLPRLPVSSI